MITLEETTELDNMTEDNKGETNSPLEDQISKIPVPTSVAMNQLRQNINQSISVAQNSGLHIENILEVFRSTVNAITTSAAEIAELEATKYYDQIQKLQDTEK